MAEKNAFESIQQFLGTADSRSEELKKAFGLKDREIQVLWAGLSAADESLNIHDFAKLAKKVAKGYPSAYLNRLKEAGFVSRGKGLGKWSVSTKAVKKIDAFLKGETVENASEPKQKPRPAKAKKVRTPRRKRAAQKAVRRPNARTGLLARIRALNAEIEAKTAERNALAFELLVGTLSK